MDIFNFLPVEMTSDNNIGKTVEKQVPKSKSIRRTFQVHSGKKNAAKSQTKSMMRTVEIEILRYIKRC